MGSCRDALRHGAMAATLGEAAAAAAGEGGMQEGRGQVVVGGGLHQRVQLKKEMRKDE